MKLFKKEKHVPRAIVVSDLPEGSGAASASLFAGDSVSLKLSQFEQTIAELEIDQDSKVDMPEGAVISFAVLIVSDLVRRGVRWIYRRFRRR